MDDKPTIEPREMIVFGVKISTRYGDFYEFFQMLEFIKEAREKNLAHLISEMFYDSNSCLCDIIIKKEFEDMKNDRAHPLKFIGLKYLSQFEWDNDTYHSIRSQQLEQQGQGE
jgi:hypothetical protein